MSDTVLQTGNVYDVIVVVIDFVKSSFYDEKKETKVKVRAIKSRKDFVFHYPPYNENCPLKKDDKILCKCELVSETDLKALVAPDIILPIDNKYIEELIRFAFPRSSSFEEAKKPFVMKSILDLSKLLNKDPFDVMGEICDKHFTLTRRYIPFECEKVLILNEEQEDLLKLTPYYKLKTAPYRLNKPLFSSQDFEELLETWIESRLYRALYCLGITQEQVFEINKPPFDLYNRIRQNPWKFCQLLPQTCIDIDQMENRESTEENKYYHNITHYIYKQMKNKGHTCIEYASFPRSINIDKVNEDILFEYGAVIREIGSYDQKDEPRLVNGIPQHTSPDGMKKVVYIRETEVMEDFVISSLVSRVKDEYYLKVPFNLTIDSKLDQDQKQAVEYAFKHNVSIITGPAGSGKTTTIKCITNNCSRDKAVAFMVSSYTGKAVVRAKEVARLGSKANTIHRMLYANTKKDFDILIMDEATMTDLQLMFELLYLYNHKFVIVLIGDVNQLAPIRYGSVFSSLVNSRSIPSTRLTSIHRVLTPNGYVDGIIANSTAIATWPENTPFAFRTEDNFLRIEGDAMLIKQLVDQFKEKGIDRKNIAIICSYAKEDPYGVDTINKVCQMIWGKGKKYCVSPHDKREWYMEDKIVMKENNYDIDVFNGQEGTVVDLKNNGIVVNFPFVEISTDEESQVDKYKNSKTVRIYLTKTEKEDDVIVNSYDKHVFFQFANKETKRERFLITNKRNRRGIPKDEDPIVDTDCITISYIITVHRAQGSEWEYGIYYMPRNAKANGGFLCKNLNYVGITRASKLMLVVGAPRIVEETIAISLPYRCEMMTNKIKSLLPRLVEYTEYKLREVKAQQLPDDFVGGFDSDDDWD